ncbi:STAS domain-containing protein [Streptomyces hundungensis]|uniref:STAS domain-containing protein n=1 Tax=Streptomyces hundungensis TaxID=1077946 RepID=UPI0033D9D34B
MRLTGEVDAVRVAAVSRRLRRRLRPGVVVLEVDLSGVRWVSADGTAAFFDVWKAARANGTRLVITNPSSEVWHVLDQVGLIRLLGSPGDGAPPPPATWRDRGPRPLRPARSSAARCRQRRWRGWLW